MMITFEQAKAAFPGGKMAGRDYVVRCPFRSRHKKRPNNTLSIKNDGGKLLLNCFSCNGHRDRDVWEELVRRVQGSGGSDAHPSTESDPVKPEKEVKPWPQYYPARDSSEWQPISQQTCDTITSKRRDYTPSVETLREHGFEKAGKYVRFPHKVNGQVRAWRLFEFTKDKNEWVFYSYGPDDSTPPDMGSLFNIDSVDLLEPLFVTEGQWDTMTLTEHGFCAASLFNAGQGTISAEARAILDKAPMVLYAPDSDEHGEKVLKRLAPLFPPERTFAFPWAEWSVKDACELRSKCGSAEQFKQEVSFLVERIEDSDTERKASPEHAEYIDKLERWDRKSPAPEPEKPQEPGMGEDAFYGIAGDYIRSLKGSSEASQEGMLVLFLAAFSSMVGHRAWTRVEETVHYPNIFAIVAGKSSRARKDTGYNRIVKPLKEADETWAKECCKSHFASGEALAEYFIKRQSDPRLFFADREFKGTLSICGREGNTLSPKVRSLYDSIAMEDNSKSGGQRVAVKTTGSWVGLITLRELRETLASVELASGFANRFLFAIARRTKRLPFGGQPVDVSKTASAVGEVLQWLDERERHIQFSDEARPIWKEFYDGLSDDDPDYLTRAEANTLRLAMNYAILNRSEEIRPEHLKAALAVWQFCAASAMEVFGPQGNPDAARLTEAVKLRGRMSRTQINDFFSGNKLAGDLDDVCAICVDVYGLKLGKDKSLSPNP